MKKFFITILALIAMCSGSSAQQKQGKVFSPIFTQYGADDVTEIGRSKIRILYAFQPVDIKDENTWIDCGQLLTDKGMTQYSSFYVSENNAYIRQWLKDNPTKDYYPGGVKLKGRMKTFWSEYQYSQIYVQGKELTDWAVMPSAEFNQYRYKEPWPSMQWKLTNEKQYICGYQCQKATCHWRGRDYEAWFTMQIPLRSGPWKFGGLPGLIMKIYDTKKIYTWEAVAVENGSFPIYQLDERRFKNSERKKVLKMHRTWNMKYAELAGVRRIGTNTPITTRYPYDPLELE